MDRITENKLRDALEVTAKKIRDSGLRAGSKAICGVILDKAEDKTKTDSEKINDIIDFCERSLGIVKGNKEA